MRPVIWSEASLRDLTSIDAFLDERNPEAGVRMLHSIRSAVTRLQEYPNIGWRVRGRFRVFSVRGTPYRVIYQLSGEQIEIARIRHTSDNWREP